MNSDSLLIINNAIANVHLSASATPKLEITQHQPGRNGQLTPKAVALTHSEKVLLLTLCRAQGEVVQRGDIFDAVWGNRLVSQSSLNQLVSSVRAKLAPYCDDTAVIVTVPRQGYKIEVANAARHSTSHSTWAKPRLLMAIAITMLASGALLATTNANPFQSDEVATIAWQQHGKLALRREAHSQHNLERLTTELAAQYQPQTEPLSLLIQDFNDYIMFDCIYHKPAWVRQRQFSLTYAEPEQMAEEILTQCNANGGYQ